MSDVTDIQEACLRLGMMNNKHAKVVLAEVERLTAERDELANLVILLNDNYFLHKPHEELVEAALAKIEGRG